MPRKHCFFVSPIGREGSSTRKSSDDVRRHIVERALNPLDYEVTRGDQISGAGLISSQVVERIINSDLVVADLTGHNPNVFYELAVRHATAKPFIQIIDKADELPFDLRDARTIEYSLSSLDSVAECVDRMQEWVRDFEGTPRQPVESPISVARVLLSPDPRSEDDQIRGLLGQVVDNIGGLRFEITQLQARLTQSERTCDSTEFANLAREWKKQQSVVRVGDNFMSEGKFGEALDFYNEALNMDARDQGALIGKAKALVRIPGNDERERLEEALQILQNVIDDDPTCGRAYYNRACYKCKAGYSAQEVIQDLEKALRHSPHYRGIARADPQLEQVRRNEAFIACTSPPAS